MYQCVHNECDSVGTLTIDWTQWYWTLYQNLSWIRIIDQSQLRKKKTNRVTNPLLKTKGYI